MRDKAWLTVDEARSRISYEPDTGRLIWKKCRSGLRIGTEAKALDVAGYVQVRVAGTLVKGHRLAWYLHYGEWPNGDIDHINGDRSDNRIANLRVVTNAINCQNKRRPLPGNKSGYLGVSPVRGSGRWVASIHINRKKHHLGVFDDPATAHEAYLKAKRQLHAGCAI